MRWPWQRRRDPCPSDAAVEAERHADRTLRDVRNLDARADAAARQSAEIRRINHIAAAVAKVIGGT